MEYCKEDEIYWRGRGIGRVKLSVGRFWVGLVGFIDCGFDFGGYFMGVLRCLGCSFRINFVLI